MRDIRIDINKGKHKVFVYTEETYSESFIRNYVSRKKKVNLGRLVANSDAVMIFAISPSGDRVKEEINLEAKEIKKNTSRKPQRSSRRRTRKTTKTEQKNE